MSAVRGPLPQAAVWFAAVFLVAFWAFWPSYLSPALSPADMATHVHGIAAFIWLALLFAQATLMRTGKRIEHRTLGLSAWVLGPLVFVSAVALAWVRTRAVDGVVEPFRYQLLFVQLGASVLFAFCLVQAWRHRRAPLLHARWMVGTAVTMLDPIFARVFSFHIAVPAWLGEYPGVAVTLLTLAALAWHEHHRTRAHRVFLPLLGLYLVYNTGVVFIGDWGPWRLFTEWFAGAA
jgi:hypothetical protein